VSIRAILLGILPHIRIISNPIWRQYFLVRNFSNRKVYDKDGDHAAVFRSIYLENFWNTSESRSGIGSTTLQTTLIRRRLPLIIKKLDVRTILDAPCGDFNWMRKVDLKGARYTGGDIVPELVDHLNGLYANDQLSFICIDIVNEDIPKFDLWICRDVLMHLPSDDVRRILVNFYKSGSRYFLATSFDLTTHNEDIPSPGFRALNLQLPPISLPPPQEKFDDFIAPVHPRIMGLWSRAQIEHAINSW
jgi:hypothetical protein